MWVCRGWHFLMNIKEYIFGILEFEGTKHVRERRRTL